MARYVGAGQEKRKGTTRESEGGGRDGRSTVIRQCGNSFEYLFETCREPKLYLAVLFLFEQWNNGRLQGLNDGFECGKFCSYVLCVLGTVHARYEFVRGHQESGGMLR